MRIALIIAVGTLSACGAQPPTSEDSTASEITETIVSEAMPPVQETYLDGQHCYFSKTDTETEALDVTFYADGSATGNHFGTVHDEANAYYTSWETALNDGEVGEASGVNFNAVTEIEGDTQTNNTDWIITDSSASEVGVEKSMTSVPCEGLVDRVWPPVEE